MELYCNTGRKGRFKASGIEFEIIDTAGATSKIRYAHDGTETEFIQDDQLKRDAVPIEKFSHGTIRARR